jgi:hypothetical protein
MRYAHLEKNQVAEKMKAVIDRFNDWLLDLRARDYCFTSALIYFYFYF